MRGCRVQNETSYYFAICTPGWASLSHVFSQVWMKMKDTLVKEVKERAESSQALNYLRFAITAFCLFNLTYMCSSGILVNRRMSLFLAVLCISVWRGLAGNAFLYNNMPVVCQNSLWSLAKFVCGALPNLFVDPCQICLWSCVKFVCGALPNLFVELCQICMWSCAKFVCGAMSNLFVELCQICMWSYAKFVCGVVPNFTWSYAKFTCVTLPN